MVVRLLMSSAICAAALIGTASAQGLLPDGAKWEKVSSAGKAFGEGVVAARDGSVYLVDLAPPGTLFRGPRLSLSTALRGSSTPLPPSGIGCWCNAVRCTNTGTCSLTPPNGYATRSPTITTTCSTQGRRPRSKRAARPSSASGGSNIARWPTAWRKPVRACSPSRASRNVNSVLCALPTSSNDCMRNSGAGL